jgi:hypothetical protein
MMTEGKVDKSSQNKITQAFLDNLTRVGLHVAYFELEDSSVKLFFSDVLPATKFIEYVQLTMPGIYLGICKHCVIVNINDIGKIKKKFAAIVKENNLTSFDLDESLEFQLESYVTSELNKLEMIVHDVLGHGEMLEGCEHVSQLNNTVAEENRRKFSLMLYMIEWLAPRELGSMTLSFGNTKTSLHLDLSGDFGFSHESDEDDQELR